MTLAPGLSIREYDVLGLVRREKGRGDLYAARHRMLGTAVALRELPRDLLLEAATRDWVLREARVFAEFDHPSVMKVIGCFEDDGRTCLVYDFLEGSLLESILRRGPLPPSQAVRITLAVGEALAAAHSHRWRLGEAWEQGIPHGDLKTGSIIVASRSEVKVMDFSPLGSVRDPSRDRRALGRLLAEMLMGSTEWTDEDYPSRLPALPFSLRELLDSLVAADNASEPPEFEEFLPVLEDIALAYEEGGLVPRAALEIPRTMDVPVSLASNPANKRLFVGDAKAHSVARYTFAGEFEELEEGLENASAGLLWMPGYGLYAAGHGCAELSLLSIHGPLPFEVDEIERRPASGPPFSPLLPMARVGRSCFAMGDNTENRVLLIDPSGRLNSVIGGSSGDGVRFLHVSGIAVGPKEELAVVDAKKNALYIFGGEGDLVSERSLADDGLDLPVGCDFDPLGNLYVADRDAGKVVIFEPDGGRVEFDELVVGDCISESTTDVHITEGGCLVAVTDSAEKSVLLFDNYFFLSSAEKSGHCVDCGFMNPVGVGRCLVCRELEQIFPVPSAVDGKPDTPPLIESNDLEEDMMLKSFIEVGEAKRTIEPLKKRLKENPDDTEAFALLAEAYLAGGESEPVAVLELLRNQEQTMWVPYLLACIFIGIKARVPAERYIEKFISLGGSQEHVTELKARLQTIPEGTSSELSRFFMRLAGLSEVENRINDALYFYSHHLDCDPDDYGTRSSLGRLLLREHRLDEAEPHYAWMLERNPYDVEALEILSCLSNKRAQWQATKEMLNNFFHDPQIGDRLIAGHGKLHYNLGVAFRELGEEKKSSREMARAKRLGFKPLSTEKIRTFFHRFKGGDHLKVVQIGEELCLEFELFRWPDAEISRSLLWKMASSYEKLDDLDRAVRCYRIFVERFPTHAAAVAANSAIAELAAKKAAALNRTG